MENTKAIERFNTMMTEINRGIVAGALDESIGKLKDALDFYESHHMTCDFINIFNKGSNVIEAATKRALFLEQIDRLLAIAKKNNLGETLTVYYRYYALAQAFYGDPRRGLEIIKDAERSLDKNTGLFIELRNAKGLILTELKDYPGALETFLKNYSEAQRLAYKPGYRFSQNIGSAYVGILDYHSAIPYFIKGIDHDLELDYELSAVEAMIELADVYLKIGAHDKAKDTLNRVYTYPVLTNNRFLHKSYCGLMYKYHKHMKAFEVALDYHETYMALELQLNMDRYAGLITMFNMKSEMSEKEKEYTLIKSKNYDLEMLGKKLESMNEFLKATLDKSKAMQEALKKKNEELEKTMASLDMTQEKLVVAEKRSVLDEMFINIAHHMSTPLGVMNTTISHMNLLMSKIDERFKNKHMSKGDLAACIEENKASLAMLNESLKKVVGFLDTLRLYKTDEEDKAVDRDLKTYFKGLIEEYKTTKGVGQVALDCPEGVHLTFNVSLLNKCIDLLADKLIASSDRNSFDVEISKEINMISIGLGDFGPCEACADKIGGDGVIDTYDFYIIETIVENLMNGRFIKFEHQGRDYFQFIFHQNS